MNVKLSNDVAARLQAHVDAGRYASLDDALIAAVDGLDRSSPATDVSAADDLLLHAIAQSQAGQLFDGQCIGIEPKRSLTSPAKTKKETSAHQDSDAASSQNNGDEDQDGNNGSGAEDNEPQDEPDDSES